MRNVHFIGICGIGMAALAAMLKHRGCDVRGSDQNVYPPMSTFLAEHGIPILSGYRAEHIVGDLDSVIVGNAISRGNPELEEVLDRKIRYRSLPEAVRDHFLWDARSIVVAGTHGKTTTTSLIGWLLASGGRDPSMLVGGIAVNFGSNWRLGAGPDFVLEGDEYDSAFFDKTAKFLKYLPDILVISNIEYDHADIYPDLASLELAFRRLVNLVPRSGLILVGANSPTALELAAASLCRVETFGTAISAHWCAHDVRVEAGRTTFELHRGDAPFGRFELPLMGTHNVLNAVAAIGVGVAAGLDAPILAKSLETFAGVKRRLETRGTVGDVTVIDDFAHHPTAVGETLKAVRAAYAGRRVWAVFEPRSASSCRRVFQQEFAIALANAKEVVLAGVFRTNLPEPERLSPEQLVADIRERGTHARYIRDVDDIVATVVQEAGPGDLVVVMSNGAFDNIHEKLLRGLASASVRAGARGSGRV